LAHARKISESITGLRSEIRGIKKTPSGELSAGCSRVPSATLVPVAVAQFKKKYPNAEISIKTGRSHEVEKWILDNEVDLGVIEGDPSSALIKKEPWYADEVVLVLSRRSPLLKRRQLSIRQILEEPFLLQAPDRRPTFIERVLETKGMRIKHPVRFGSREAVKAATVAGYGVSLLPRLVIDAELKAGLLKTKKIDDLDISYPMNIIYHRDKQLSASARCFLRVLRKQSSQLRVPGVFASRTRGKLPAVAVNP
jgi:DNA-binding transcriptional LysR family regulator